MVNEADGSKRMVGRVVRLNRANKRLVVRLGAKGGRCELLYLEKTWSVSFLAVTTGGTHDWSPFWASLT